MLLEVRGLTAHYGKALAVDNVSFAVEEGSAVGLMGANGAGKSTVLKALSGLIPVTSGQIWYDDVDIAGMKPLEIVKRGLVHVPEGRHLFPYLTVMSNLRLGASLRKDKAEIKESFDNVFHHFPRLWERRNQVAGTLSGGEQQMAAIGRGLMAKPRLLLMDEPSLGLAPRMVAELIPVIREINKSNVSVLLVEQNTFLALGVVSKGYVLQVGKLVLEGDVGTLEKSEYLHDAYLGKKVR